MTATWSNSSSRNGPQFAGWVSTTSPGGSPIRSVAASTTQRSSCAVSACGENGAPATMIGTWSPIRRLNSRANRSGSLSPRRSAASPTRNSPSGFKNSTEGICSARLPRPITVGSDPSVTAAAVNVVPRSTPSRYGIHALVSDRARSEALAPPWCSEPTLRRRNRVEHQRGVHAGTVSGSGLSTTRRGLPLARSSTCRSPLLFGPLLYAIRRHPATTTGPGRSRLGSLTRVARSAPCRRTGRSITSRAVRPATERQLPALRGHDRVGVLAVPALGEPDRRDPRRRAAIRYSAPPSPSPSELRQ